MKPLAALLLTLLLASSSEAATRLLLLEDIGSPDARFSWSGVDDGQVEFSATVYRRVCWNQECYDFHSTGALEGFKRDSRDVYYVGEGDQTPILCGRTDGFLSRARFYDTCRVSVEPERVCEVWYAVGDCVESRTRFRVYLDVDDQALASGAGEPPRRSEGF